MNPDRFEALLAPLLDSAYRTALCLADGPDEAEAMLQEAAGLEFHRFEQRGPGSDLRWCFLRSLVETFRRRHRQGMGSGAACGGQASAPQGNRVLAAIRRLSPCRRLVAALYFRGGLNCGEIAGVLRCSRPAVRQRVGTVRSAFRPLVSAGPSAGDLGLRPSGFTETYVERARPR